MDLLKSSWASCARRQTEYSPRRLMSNDGGRPHLPPILTSLGHEVEWCQIQPAPISRGNVDTTTRATRRFLHSRMEPFREVQSDTVASSSPPWMTWHPVLVLIFLCALFLALVDASLIKHRHHRLDKLGVLIVDPAEHRQVLELHRIRDSQESEYWDRPIDRPSSYVIP